MPRTDRSVRLCEKAAIVEVDVDMVVIRGFVREVDDFSRRRSVVELGFEPLFEKGEEPRNGHLVRITGLCQDG